MTSQLTRRRLRTGHHRREVGGGVQLDMGFSCSTIGNPESIHLVLDEADCSFAITSGTLTRCSLRNHT